jgi:phosphate transport system substrate-binding protein
VKLAILLPLVLASGLAPVRAQGHPAYGICTSETAQPSVRKGSIPPILPSLAMAWRDGFSRLRPDVAIDFPAPHGPPQGALDPQLAAFLDGRLDFAFLTREIAEADLMRFRRTHRGALPVVVPVAGGSWNRFGFVDPVVVIVHETNPLRAIDLRRLDGIFSSTRLRGGADIIDWGAAGARDWRGKPIHIVGGDAWAGEESARALFMRRQVLSLPGNRGHWRIVSGSGDEADNVERVARDPLAIGFTGFGHVLPGTRALAIIPRPGSKPVAPTREAIASRRYPFARTVDLLLARGADGCIDPMLAAFASFIIGPEGQRIVTRQGVFLPLTRDQAMASRRLIAGDRANRSLDSTNMAIAMGTASGRRP